MGICVYMLNKHPHVYMLSVYMHIYIHMFAKRSSLRGSRYVCKGGSFTGIAVCLELVFLYLDQGMFAKGVPLQGSRYVRKGD